MPRGPVSSVSGFSLGSDARRWLNRIGALLGAAGVVFVALRLASYAGEIDAAGIGPGGYAALFGLAAVYGASNLLLALGWWGLLRCLGVTAARGWALRAYAISQFAKYVPGNIFQFAGRQAIGVAAGFGNKPLAKSTLLELGLLTGCGALFALLAAPLSFRWMGFAPATPFLHWLALAAFAGIAFLAALALARFGGRGFQLAALSYFTFLALSGVVFAGCLAVAGGEAATAQLPAVVGAYVIAWLAGLVTPGAPAGIGVREAVLLVLLGNLAAPPVILLAVVIGRAVTVVGDVGFYLAGHSIGRPREARKADG